MGTQHLAFSPLSITFLLIVDLVDVIPPPPLTALFPRLMIIAPLGPRPLNWAVRVRLAFLRSRLLLHGSGEAVRPRRRSSVANRKKRDDLTLVLYLTVFRTSVAYSLSWRVETNGMEAAWAPPRSCIHEQIAPWRTHT